MVSLVSILNDILYILEMTSIIYRLRLTYNMSILFYSTCVNIGNPPSATWISSSCIKIKSIKIEQ